MAVSKVKREVTVLVVVGCGGITYHGLSRMATFCNRREYARAAFIDPDVIEAKNASRQWGKDEGMTKVEKVTGAMTQLSDAASSLSPILARIGKPNDFVKAVQTYMKGFVNEWRDVKQVVVVSSPDNHLCRMNVHKGCIKLCKEIMPPVYEITAGNGPDYGYAYGCKHIFDEKGTAIAKSVGVKPSLKPVGLYQCIGDWVRMHPDIKNEAQREARALAHPAACGDMKEEVPGQTMTTNQLTALCVWDLAEIMVCDSKVGEVYWVHENTPEKGIYVTRAKLAKI